MSPRRDAFARALFVAFGALAFVAVAGGTAFANDACRSNTASDCKNVGAIIGIGGTMATLGAIGKAVLGGSKPLTEGNCRDGLAQIDRDLDAVVADINETVSEKLKELGAFSAREEKLRAARPPGPAAAIEQWQQAMNALAAEGATLDQKLATMDGNNESLVKVIDELMETRKALQAKCKDLIGDYWVRRPPKISRGEGGRITQAEGSTAGPVQPPRTPSLLVNGIVKTLIDDGKARVSTGAIIDEALGPMLNRLSPGQRAVVDLMNPEIDEVNMTPTADGVRIKIPIKTLAGLNIEYVTVRLRVVDGAFTGTVEQIPGGDLTKKLAAVGLNVPTPAKATVDMRNFLNNLNGALGDAGKVPQSVGVDSGGNLTFQTGPKPAGP